MKNKITIVLGIILTGCGSSQTQLIEKPKVVSTTVTETVYVDKPGPVVNNYICPANQHVEGTRCIDNTRSCSPNNGSGIQIFSNGSFGDCTVVECNTGFFKQGNACVASCTAGYALTNTYSNNNIIQNGDFEDLTGIDPALARVPNLWGVYDKLPGWKTYKGAGIEPRFYGYLGGDNTTTFVELDSDNESGMQQYINTPKKGKYKLHVDYIPRTNGGGDNDIQIKIDGINVLFLTGYIRDFSSWRGYEITVELDCGIHNLQVEALNCPNGLGGYVDNLALNQQVKECKQIVPVNNCSTCH